MIFLYILVFEMPFYRHPILDAGSGLFTLVKAVGALGLAAALVYVLARGIPDYLETRQAKLFMAMVGMAILSFLRNGRPPNLEVGSPILIYISMVVFFVIIVSMVDTADKIRRSLLVANVSIACASFYILREFQLYHNLYALFRPAGTIVGDSNYFSMAGMLALPIGYFYFTAEKRPFYRWSTLVCVVITSIAIAVSGSRGGLLALVAFVCFVVYRSRHRARNFFILVLILLPPMLLVPRNPIIRMMHPDYADRAAAHVRIETWRAGLGMWRDYPILGIGLGEFKPHIAAYAGDPKLSKLAHNTYLEILSELGIVCLLLYLWLLRETYMSLKWTGQIAKRFKAPLLYAVATGMQGGLIGFLVSSFFLSAEYVKFFWFYVFYSIAIMQVTRRWALQQIRLKKNTSPPTYGDSVVPA
jgi:O-antigen ligase